MDPYIAVAVNAGQTLAAHGADYLEREQKRRTYGLIALAGVALLLVFLAKRGK